MLVVAGIILIIIGGIVSLVIISSDNDGWLWGILGIIAYTVGLVFVCHFIFTKNTAINCYEGNNPYEQQIIYELKDSIYVPKDTIYVLK